MSVSNLVSNNGISALSNIDCASLTSTGSLNAGTSIIGAGTIYSGSASVNGVFSGFTGKDVFYQSGATTYLQGTTEVKIRSPSSTELMSCNSTRVQVSKPFSVANGAGQYLKLPSLTTAERDALTASAGMIVFNSTTSKLNVYTGAAWEVITSA